MNLDRILWALGDAALRGEVVWRDVADIKYLLERLERLEGDLGPADAALAANYASLHWRARQTRAAA